MDDGIRTMAPVVRGLPLPNQRNAPVNPIPVVSAPLPVMAVFDGDTIVVAKPNGTQVTVRAAYMDAPEVAYTKAASLRRDPAALSQFRWGNLAKSRLQQWLAQNGNRVRLRELSKDAYGRTVAEIYPARNGDMVQLTLLKEGLAVPYFLPKTSLGTSLQSIGDSAKQRRLGFWSDNRFQLPSQFRN